VSLEAEESACRGHTSILEIKSTFRDQIKDFRAKYSACEGRECL
jgi:hypothetical protein